MADNKDVLAQRVEEACLNGWPALQTIWLDGWLLRFSHGHTRRANSISLLRPGARQPREQIRSAEAFYTHHGLPTIFRLSSVSAQDIGGALDEAGYGPGEDETRVLYRDFAAAPPPADRGTAVVRPRLDDTWFEAHARIQGLSATAAANARALFGAVAVPTGYAVSPAADGHPAALAFGAVHDGIVCINAVATDPGFRRRGHACSAINALLAWAQDDQGAKGACLPVVGGNDAGRSLYRSLAFSTEISRYSYRRKVA
ncbi:GNAT family N-acetyltransferase [Labrys sp. KNU-23]|uniref:GNAT family N-acetyltransferase n=1 Tax=Labrys sp. KNU-23 TaxID=2789216 RepID=UPI0011EC7727|nr:GNAT family N-acetyltransferase [Labrys sp. KNU-23]QEN87029.1 GNAT family N-acetyltransferase [Labrys sp. KNU-23]